MDNEKLNIVMAPGMNKAEVTIREGAAVRELEIKAPIPMDVTGTIGAPFEFLYKRSGIGQFDLHESHIVVNREKVAISLVINESDPYKRATISGQLAFHPAFVAFGINSGKVWTPTELGMFMKMNRAFFADKKSNMELVTALMNFTATVNNNIERSANERGNRTDNFAQVVNSNLPAAFTLKIPIFKGMPAETIEVETFAQVDGREVSFVLLSPGANETLEALRDKQIDEQLDKIREITPDVAIFEV